MSQSLQTDEMQTLGDQPTAAFDDAEDSLDQDSLGLDDFEEGEAYDDALGDEADLFDAYDDELDDAGNEALAADAGEEEQADQVEAAWSAFADDIADALDAEQTDEFLSSILGGFARAAGGVARGLAPAARVARRGQGIAQGVGNVATGLGQLSNAAALAARWFGAPGAAAALGRFGQGARQVGNVAGQIGGALGTVPAARRHARQAAHLAGQAAQAPNPIGQLLGSLGQLLGNGADDFEAFDTMADLYVEDGIDEALPAAVALASRAAARALGWQNVGQLSHAARRALVQGIATAARTLINRQGPHAVRALPRIAQATSRAARRHQAKPQQAARITARQTPRTAQRVAQQPKLVQQLAQPTAKTRPLARPTDIGRGAPAILRGTTRRYRFDGPIELTIRAL